MVDLNINLVAKMAGAGAGGAAGGVAGAAGAGLAGRAGGVMAAGLMGGAGSRTEMIGKGLGQISKQLPGAGMMGEMAGAFKAGGIVGVGMAGVAGIMGFVKQIMESSKVFQGIAGSFFKIFGAMADVFLLPFLPLAMRGMNMLMKYLPDFGRWGEKTAQGVENIIRTFQDKGWIGGIVHYIKEAWTFISVDVKDWITGTLKPAIAEAVLAMGKTLLNALKGKETKYVAPRGAPSSGSLGGGGPIRDELGSKDFLNPEFYANPVANFYAKWNNKVLPGNMQIPMRAKQGQYKVWDATGERLTEEQQRYIDDWEREGLSEEEIKKKVAAGLGPFSPTAEGGAEHIASWSTNQLGGRIPSYQPGGEVPGGPGQGRHVMLHGGEGIIPADNMSAAKALKGDAIDILVGTGGELQVLASAVNELKLRGRNDRLNPRSASNQLKNLAVKEILPQTLNNVGDFYDELGDMTDRVQNNTWGAGRGIVSRASVFAADTDKKKKEQDKDVDKIKEKTVEDFIKEYTGPPSAQYATPQGLNGGVNIYGPGRTGIFSGPAVTWGGKTVKKYTAEEAAAAVKSGVLIPEGGFNRTDPTDMDRLEYNIQQQQGKGIGGGLYFTNTDIEGEDRTEEQKALDRKNSLAAIEERKRNEIEAQRLTDSLTAARAAIYGPEGGINEAGEFIHGGLLARTSDSEAMRLKTFDEVDLTDQQRADLAAVGPEAYDFLQVGTTTIKAPAPKAEAIFDEEKQKYVRPPKEVMELAKRMAAQLNYIASFQQKIDDAAAIKRNIVANRLPGESTEAHYRRERAQGDIVEDLRRDRSRAEEAHTRMINQSVQDRLPYSLQEFQTRFPEDFPESDKGYGTGSYAAGGIVPGDIGEHQIVMAHGGETVSPIGMTGGRQGHTSNRVMNISINNASSVRDILRDLNDMESMDDASFFNSVS